MRLKPLIAKQYMMKGCEKSRDKVYSTNTMAIEKSLVSGSMTMLILKLLSEKDMYGYEMIDTLRQKSQNVFELKAGTLYPLLHSLEDKGFLTVYEQEAAGKTRKYYSLTRQGRGFLEKKVEEWKEYSAAVTNVIVMEV